MISKFHGNGMTMRGKKLPKPNSAYHLPEEIIALNADKTGRISIPSAEPPIVIKYQVISPERHILATINWLSKL